MITEDQEIDNMLRKLEEMQERRNIELNRQPLSHYELGHIYIGLYEEHMRKITDSKD